jgi:hypothetical protein
MPFGDTNKPLPPGLEPQLVSMGIARKLLGIGETLTWRLAKSGRLETVWIEGRRLVVYASIMRLLDELRAAPTANRSRYEAEKSQHATAASIAARSARTAKRRNASPSVGQAKPVGAA